MIFVTVGTQFPFDRLVSAVDAWACRSKRRDVIAQIGEGVNTPSFIEWNRFVDASKCHDLLRDADLVVCHAGMGTVLTCLTSGTPVIVMPRLAALGEHRNDHQLDTVRWMRDLPGVRIVETVEELTAALEMGVEAAGETISPHSDPQLTLTIRNFVNSAALNGRRSLRFRVGTLVGRLLSWTLPRGRTMTEVPASVASVAVGGEESVRSISECQSLRATG